MCTGIESSLLDCAAGEEVGSHNCDHSEDAGVRCEGITASHLLTSYVQKLMVRSTYFSCMRRRGYPIES